MKFWFGLTMLIAVLNVSAADTWKHVSKENQPGFPGDEIQFIKAGSEKDQVWIGTLTGAVEAKDGVLHPLATTKGKKIWDITPQPDGGYWIGHERGLLLVNGDKATPMLEGLSVPTIKKVGSQMWALAQSAKGTNTLMQYDGKKWDPVPAFEKIAALDLVADSKGTFWLVLDGDGVIEVDPKVDPAKAPHHLPRLNVTSIMTDSKGRTWCGMMGGGAMVRENDKWNRHLADERQAILDMVEDGAGKIWAATGGNGVWVFDGKKWDGMLQDEGAVNLIRVTSDKRVWVSTNGQGGLRYWDGKAWQSSLESPSQKRCLLELPGGVILAGGVLDGVHILGNYSLKGE